MPRRSNTTKRPESPNSGHIIKAIRSGYYLPSRGLIEASRGATIAQVLLGLSKLGIELSIQAYSEIENNVNHSRNPRFLGAFVVAMEVSDPRLSTWLVTRATLENGSERFAAGQSLDPVLGNPALPQTAEESWDWIKRLERGEPLPEPGPEISAEQRARMEAFHRGLIDAVLNNTNSPAE